MTVQLSCQEISKSFGVKELFKGIKFSIAADDRIGLIGANGAGKSTFLKIMAGDIEPDDGLVTKKQGVRVSYLPQDPPLPDAVSVSDYLLDYWSRNGNFSQTELDKKLSQSLAATGLSNDPIKQLSGGQRKRLAIVAQWHLDSDVWLLDEPTNHLDFEGILWLQGLLKKGRMAFVVISHDRYFLDEVVKATAEIAGLYEDGFLVLSGGYSSFIEQKQVLLEEIAQELQSLENKMRREGEWLSRQPKARGTKARFRIEAAHDLSQQLGSLKSRLKRKDIAYDFSSRDRKTKRLVNLDKVAVGYEQSAPLAADLELVLSPGKIVGVVGTNGTGKSTLLGAIDRDAHILAGTITRAHDLRIVYFDQLRKDLDGRETLGKALAPEGDGVLYQGRVIHINAWADMLGFERDRLHTLVGDLSGGERARVLLGRIIREEADVLLLDEPTNDLDIQALEVLEQSMLSFTGAVVLITHDRYLLSHVCDEIVGFLPGNTARIYADYEQWQREFMATAKEKKQELRAAKAKEEPSSQVRSPRKAKRLTYKDQREYDGMEQRIAEAEARVANYNQQVSQAPQNDAGKIEHLYQELHSAQQDLDALYERWAELEDMVSDS